MAGTVMGTMTTIFRNFLIFCFYVGTLVCVPIFASAQVDDMRAVLHNSLAEDSNSVNLSPDEFAALIEALAERAGEVGVTGESIALDTLDDARVETCTFSRFLCVFSEAFGVGGNDHRLLIALGASAGALMLIFGKVFARHLKTQESQKT